MGKAELGKPIVLGQLEPGSPDTAAILWLHGFGDTPGGWAAALQPFRTSVDAKWKWIHLCAPTLSQPCFQNQKLKAWGQFVTQEKIKPGSTDYMDNDSGGAYAGSVEAVLAELKQLEQSVPPNRLLIGGFSQGAAIALECALRYPKVLAGCIVLAGWARPPVRELLTSKGKQETSTPFLLCHGESDDMVDLACADTAKDLLLQSGAQVQLRKYPGIQHESCPDLLNDVMGFICKQLQLPIPEGITWENGSDSDSDNALIYVSKSRLNALQNLPGEEISSESIVKLVDPTGLAETETLVPAVVEQPAQLFSMPPSEAIKVIAEAVRNFTGQEITVKELNERMNESSDIEEAEEEELSIDNTDDENPQDEAQPGEDSEVREPLEKKLRGGDN